MQVEAFTELERPVVFTVLDPEQCPISRALVTEGTYEPCETALMKRLLADYGPKVFYDVGAHMGYFTLLASRLLGEKGQVVALEPDAVNFAALQHNLRTNACHNVTALNVAASDTPGTSRLYRSETNLGDHRLYASDEARAASPVECVRLDEIIRQTALRPDVIKVDTQGCEVAVLRGMGEIMRDGSRAPLMLMEYWPFGLRMRGDQPDLLLDIIEASRMPLVALADGPCRAFHVAPAELRKWTDVGFRPESRRYFNLLLAPDTPAGRAHLSDATAPTMAPLAMDRMHATVRDSDALRMLLPVGWSFPMPWGVWSDGPAAGIRIPLPPGLSGDVALHLLVRGFVKDGHGTDFSVTAGPHTLGHWSVATPARQITMTVPADVVDQERTLEVWFHIANPRAPEGDTKRLLGVGLQGVGIGPASGVRPFG